MHELQWYNCDNSQAPLENSDEEVETETIFQQKYDENENENDCNETDKGFVQ